MSSDARSEIDWLTLRLGEILRVDLQMVVELSEHDSDCLSAEGMYIVGDASLVRLMRCRGLSKQRAKEIYDAVNLFVERMLRT